MNDCQNKNYKILSYQSVAKQMNNRVYTHYYYKLMLIARSLFEWKNLPNGINEKWIERYLFSEGSCVFYKDPTIGFMVILHVLHGQAAVKGGNFVCCS